MKKLLIIIFSLLLGVANAQPVAWQDVGISGDSLRLEYSQKGIVRAPAILTNDYVAGTIIDVVRAGQISIYVTVQLGSLTSVQLKIEESDKNDGSFYAECIEKINPDTGTATLMPKIYTFTANNNYMIRYPVTANKIKISVKGMGAVADSSCAVYVICGWGN